MAEAEWTLQDAKNFIEHLLSIPKRPPSIPDDEELLPREPFVGRPFEFDEDDLER